MAPQDVMLPEGTEAKFTCTATTDPDEVDNLRLYWRKDGVEIDYAVSTAVCSSSCAALGQFRFPVHVAAMRDLMGGIVSVKTAFDACRQSHCGKQRVLKMHTSKS